LALEVRTFLTGFPKSEQSLERYRFESHQARISLTPSIMAEPTSWLTILSDGVEARRLCRTPSRERGLSVDFP